MVEEDYVSFEVANLLKEKGFDGTCYACYEYFESGVTLYRGWPFEYKGTPVKNSHDRIKCPTLQMAMKWLREEKHIYIQIMLDSFACEGSSGYYVVLQKTDSDYESMLSDFVEAVFYETYKEAAMEAIKICLTKLL